MDTDPFIILGIPHDSTATRIRLAWRQKAATLHPDVGGTHHDMVLLNEALDSALHIAEQRTVMKETNRGQSVTPRHAKSFVGRDVSCFTIEALPVEAWHLLFMGASQCGPIVDEEEPYLLEFMLSDTSMESLRTLMCRCEIVPEAGASMVHLAVYGDRGKTTDIETVRDLLISAINELGDDVSP